MNKKLISHLECSAYLMTCYPDEFSKGKIPDLAFIKTESNYN